MAGMNYKTATVGAIAAYDYRAVPVFHRYGIDFCCHGEEPFIEACAKAGASVEEVYSLGSSTPRAKRRILFLRF